MRFAASARWRPRGRTLVGTYDPAQALEWPIGLNAARRATSLHFPPHPEGDWEDL